MKKQKLKIVINVIFIMIFIVLLLYISIEYSPFIIEMIRNPNVLKTNLTAYGNKSIFVFLAIQIVQVVIPAIPGEVVQLAGGYIYGTIWGALYSSIGILFGSILSFYISRILGYRLVKLIISENHMKKLEYLTHTSKSEVATFILFLIPGMPKDIMTYLAGLTPISPTGFFVLAITARFPGILISSFIGAHLEQKQYHEVAIVAVVALMLTVLSIVFKDRMIKQIRNWKEKN